MQKEWDVLGLLLKHRWLRHVAYWTAAFVFTVSLNWVIDRKLIWELGLSAFLLPIRMAAAYFVAYFLIPKLLLKRRFLLTVLAFVFAYYMLTALTRIFMVHVWEPMILEPGFDQESIAEILTDVSFLIKRYFFTVFSASWLFVILKLVKDQYVDRRQREQLEKEKTIAELNFLKAQIHPHFLFNTLNNLYSLTLKKSDKAPEMLLKLSDMLDYMLYQCSEDRVPIHKEVELLHNYIELEKLRYGNRLNLGLKKDIDDLNAPVSPIILLSLVENAFKHGASGDIGQPRIEIRIHVKERRLRFEVFNSKPLVVQEDETGYKKGIGVSNVKRQLNLVYPGQHTFEEFVAVDSHHVKLQIELEEIV